MSIKLPPEVKAANKKVSDKRYASENKDRIASYQKQYKLDHPESRDSSWFRAYNLKKAHGLTPTQFDGWFLSQNQRCASCGTSEPGGQYNRWCVDHDHLTGLKRGILCNACNLALGYAKDSIRNLQSLIGYLQFKPDYNLEII